MIAVACPGCGASLKLEDGYIKRAETCPKCGKRLGSTFEHAPTLTAVVPASEEPTFSPPRMPSHSGAPVSPAELASFLAPPEGPDEIGRLGNYRVLRVLGTGAMGIVFEAEDIHLKRRVALKVVLPALAASPTARQRFLREARAAAEVESDHVVTIYQVGEDRNVPYLAMQFLKGETLDDRLQKGRLPLPEVLRIGREMALGLAAAHARGLVHRDIKPSNTWLESQAHAAHPGVGDRVKILDFGLARGVGEDAHLTRQGTIIGTPSYMSPEQARGSPATAQSDLFSLGTVLYRMSTGTLPFKGDDTVATLLAVGIETPPPPRSVSPEIPPALDELILRLLAKEQSDRPGSAAEVANLIRGIEADSSLPLAAPTREVRRAEKTMPMPAQRGRRRGLVLTLSLLILVGLGVFLALRFVGSGKSRNSTLNSTGATSSLDRLRAEDVPAEERVAGLENELVAVIGHRNASAIQGVAFSPDGRLLAGAGREGDGHVWDASTGHQLLSIACQRILFTPDGKSLVTVASDGISFWDLSGKRQGTVPKKENEDVHAIDIAADGKLLIWGGIKVTRPAPKKKVVDGIVRVWDLVQHKEIADLPGTMQPIYAVKLSPDGTLAAAMSADRSAYLWDVGTRKEKKFTHAAAGNPTAAVLQPGRTSPIAFSPDNKLLAVGRRGTTFLVDVQSGEDRTMLRELGGFVHSIAFTPAAPLLATVDARGTVIVFELSGKKVREWPMPGLCNDAVFAPDGRHLAVAGSNGTVYILRISAPASE
jgi:serine/threonine protein kinase/WD40 repeat protein